MYPLLIATLSSNLYALVAVAVVAVAAAAAAAATVIGGAVAVMRIMIRMMMMRTYLVAPQQVPQILPPHLVTTMNRILSPRVIVVWLYIVLWVGWWMWMPCQVMAVLCRCSAKGSTTFTVQAKMNRQLAFFWD